MALWGLGKLKSISEKMHIMDMGSKLKSYVVSQSTDDPNNKASTPNKLSPETMMARQMEAYNQLMVLQEEILAQIQAEKEQEFVERELELIKRLSQAQQIVKKQRKQHEIQQIAQQIESGQRDLRSVIRENTLLREQVSSKRATI